MITTVEGQAEGLLYLEKMIEGTLTGPFLLVGESGVGKRFSVFEAAKQLFKEEDVPEDQCPQCYQLINGLHPDFKVVATEGGKDIKVSAIRDLVQEAASQPLRGGGVKFLVIDGADCLTTASANALLKVLEEAPSYVRFFLLAEQESLVLPTIRSRSILVRYRNLPESFVVSKLKEHTDDDAKALVYARLASGSLGRATKYLGASKLSLRDSVLGLLETVAKGDVPTLFSSIDGLGSELKLGIQFLDHLLYDLTMIAHDPTRITNLDKEKELRALRGSLQGVLPQLRAGLGEVRTRSKRPINLAFHLKTVLASAAS